MPPTAALSFADAARPDLVEVLKAGGATIRAGHTTIDLETPDDIDAAVEIIQKINEPKSEKGAGKRKKANERVLREPNRKSR
jgi:hypothetical protein